MFYRSLAGAIRAAKLDGSATWALLGLSFAYGVFHAAGPGHGKAVISSYLVANDETWRRGVVLSFASALLQAVVAVAIVGIAAVLLGMTGSAMGETVRWIEIVSYALIALIGARLLWVKGGALLRALRASPHDHHHEHDHHHHEHHDYGDACGHDHASAWGHAHGPEPQDLAGPGGWWRGLSAIVAVGLRPCSGAIIVLVFALAQGIFLTGIVATLAMGLGTALTVTAIAVLAVGGRGLASRLAKTKPGIGMILLRVLETVAAALVLAFGVLLLLGYLASEKLPMV
ncbi:MAG: nickel/cobalt transporter [Pseudolabrys sp.]|nr:nickel/cobalt transporter [Pseudolabrys sp.]